MIRAREHPVLLIDPLVVLLTIQCLLISAGFSIFMIIRYRNLLAIKNAAQKEMQVLHTEINRQYLVNSELMEWKGRFEELQEEFEGIRAINEKLKDAVASLIPEAERSKEYEQLIADIEESNKTLDNCIGSLRKDNKELENTMAALEREANGLADLLQKSVRKEEFDRAVEKKRSIELKYKKIVAEFDQLRTEHEKLQQSNKSLQKEYNALYDNIEEDKKGLAESSA